MTAAQLRSLATLVPVTAASPLRLVDEAGVEYAVVGRSLNCKAVPKDDSAAAVLVCESPPTLTLRLKRIGPTPTAPTEPSDAESAAAVAAVDAGRLAK